MSIWKPSNPGYSLILTFFLFTNSMNGQNGFVSTAGARSLALGEVSTTLDDLSGIFMGSPAIAFHERTGFCTYGSQHFGLAKLSEAGFAGSFSTAGLGSFFGSFRSAGFEAYKEIKFSFGYARKILANFALSASFNYHQLRIPEYGSAAAPSVEIGLYHKPFKTLALGVHVMNPIPFSHKSGLRLPTMLRCGLAYTPGKTVTIYSEIEKDADHPVTFKAGIEYMPLPPFVIRMGARTEPASMHMGAGYQVWEKWTIDVGVSYDIRLGLTPGISLSFRPQKGES